MNTRSAISGAFCSFFYFKIRKKPPLGTILLETNWPIFFNANTQIPPDTLKHVASSKRSNPTTTTLELEDLDTCTQGGLRRGGLTPALAPRMPVVPRMYCITRRFAPRAAYAARYACLGRKNSVIADKGL